MKTIDLKEFIDNFMEISKKLTHAELQMLYLFIAEIDVINLSQQKIADRLGVNRRTIILGIKKLLKNKYISDINITLKKAVRSDKNIKENTGEKIEKVKVDEEQNKNNEIRIYNALEEQKYNKLLFNIEYEPDSLSDCFIELFDNYPDRYLSTLTILRNNLPKDINLLAEKYGFVDELKILRISNKNIKIFEKNNKYIFNCQLQLWHKYNNFYNKNRKTAAMKIVRQALVYFPFTFNEFLNDIGKFGFSDFDELVQSMLKEIYKDDKLITLITKSI